MFPDTGVYGQVGAAEPGLAVCQRSWRWDLILDTCDTRLCGEFQGGKAKKTGKENSRAAVERRCSIGLLESKDTQQQ